MVGKDILGRTGGVSAAAAALACTALATGAPAASATAVKCGSITASGSSLQNLAHKTVWIKDWEDNGINGWKVESEGMVCEEEKKEGVGTGKGTGKVEYEPTSSGKGLSEWGDESEGVMEAFKPEKSHNKEHLDAFVGTDVGPEGRKTAGHEEEMPESNTQISNIDAAGGHLNEKGEKESNTITTIPIATSAVALPVSLPEGCRVNSHKAVVNLRALIREWSSGGVKFSEMIENLESSAACEATPVLQAREVPSGTTAAYKRYLADLDPTDFGSITETAGESESNTNWPLEVGKSADFNETGNETGGELAKRVYETSGTMGYADISDARNQEFTEAPGRPKTHGPVGKEYESLVVLVHNGKPEAAKEGESESPQVEQGSHVKASHCENAKFPEPKKVGPDIDWSRAKQENATSAELGVYPICTLTFDVAWGHYRWVKWENAAKTQQEMYSEAQYNTAFNYLRWVVTAGQEGTPAKELEENNFEPLPEPVLKEAREGVTKAHISWE